MFYVVHVDEWFQTIPDNWVNKKNKTIYWPTEKNAMLTMWIKKSTIQIGLEDTQLHLFVWTIR